MATETRIEGMAELHKLLQGLPAKVEGNVMRGALRAGQKVFMEAAKAAVPVDKGALRDSIKISFRARSQKHGVVRMHLQAGGKTAWYAHIIEYGTASYYTGKGRTVGKPYTIKPKEGSKVGALFFGGVMREAVQHPGIKPRPFMRPAVDGYSQQAIDATANYIRTRLPKELKKAGQ